MPPEPSESEVPVMGINFSDAVSYGMIFHQQIRQQQEQAYGSKWSWERLLPGPIDDEEAQTIMGIAGCWCYDPREDEVRFYTNQNHPSWSRIRQPLY